jgi:dTDP-4-dehydrorhamnose reductase
MKICVIGAGGMLGQDMVKVIRKSKHTVVSASGVDITYPSLIKRFLTTIKPRLIINCAAYTDVDGCEDSSKVSRAFKVNAEGPENLARAAKELDIPIVHISTDYVFDGRSKRPYTEGDPTNPLSVYGKSKLEGEERLKAVTDKFYILRVAWLYGKHGDNFVKTISNLAKDREVLKVVNDQFGSPTWTEDVCRQILTIIDKGDYGTYHTTSESSCSWFEFTKYIVESCGIDCDILPCTSGEYPRPAPRPAYSVLNNDLLKSQGINIMPQWEEGFDRFLEDT